MVGMFTDARLPTASSALQRLVVVWCRGQTLGKFSSNEKPYLILRVEVDPTVHVLVYYLRCGYPARAYLLP